MDFDIVPGSDGTFEVWVDVVLLRRKFSSREEAQKWGERYIAGEMQRYYWPSSILWGDDYDETKGMKWVYASSKEDALEWIQTRYGGAHFTISNIFPTQI